MSSLSLIETRALLLYPWSSLIYCTRGQQIERGFPHESFRGAQMHTAPWPPTISSQLAPCSPCSQNQGLCTRRCQDPGQTPSPSTCHLGKRTDGQILHQGGDGGARAATLATTHSSFVLPRGLSPGSIPDGAALTLKTPETICL